MQDAKQNVQYDLIYVHVFAGICKNFFLEGFMSKS